MAALLAKELGLACELIVGRSGEFTVWFGTTLLAEKDHGRFPDPADVVAAARAATAAR